MRDKNLSYQQFNIQLEKNLEILVNQGFQKLLTERVIITPTLLSDFYFRYPRDYRTLRSLCIVQWFFPENLHYHIYLDLCEMSFSHLSRKQILELKILLLSKEKMITYLYETKRYTGNEIFGNILKKDILELSKILKIKRTNRKIVRPQRRRGYNDHGSMRFPETWLPDSDYTLTEQQLKKEKRLYLLNKSTQKVNQILEALVEMSKQSKK